MTSARSVLYVPGDRSDMLAHAVSRGADALILDLEDAVAPTAKELARHTVFDFLRTRAASDVGDVEIWVRVNPGELGLADIAAVASPALAGFVLAKTEHTHHVRAAGYAADEVEQRLALTPGSLGLCPLLESAAAVMDARGIAGASARVRRLQIGEADLRAEIGVSLGDTEHELLLVRSAVVLASAAAGVGAPLASVSTDFTDLDRFRATTEAQRRLGFRGRACIHPAQCAVANEVFTPSAEQMQQAQRLIERYEAAASDAVFTDEDGRMVDLAVIRDARRLVAHTEQTARPIRGATR